MCGNSVESVVERLTVLLRRTIVCLGSILNCVGQQEEVVGIRLHCVALYRCCIFVVGMRQDKWAHREASRPKLKGIWGSKVRPTFGRALCEIEYNHLVEHIAAVFFLISICSDKLQKLFAINYLLVYIYYEVVFIYNST